MRYFWLILTITAVVWYIFVTAYVAFKGVADIKEMLHRLSSRKSATSEESATDAS